MSRFQLGLIAALLMTLLFALGAWKSHEAGADGEEGAFPEDWFLRQRTWPDQRIEVVEYMAAVHAADRLDARSSLLDTQPPWIGAGPTNIVGRIADVVGHPTNAQIIYVAAASGGVFKSVNGGISWTPIFDNATTLSTGALAMDVAHPDTLYLGTGEPCGAGFSYFGTGVYRTTNGGASWTPLGLENTKYISRIVIDPEDSQTLWVAAMGELYSTNQERGLYRSTDGGTNWQRMLFVNDSTGCSDVVVNPLNTNIIYAAMWQRIRSPELRRVGGRGSGIFRSTDRGTTWERLTDGLPPPAENVGRIGLSICASSPLVLYASYADDPGFFAGVYRTADGGDSWNRTNDSSLDDLFSSFGWYFGNVRVRPDNPNIVFVLGQQLARSTNGGQSWSIIGQNVHVDHHALWFRPAQPQQMLLGNDGGLYSSTNNGNSFTFIPGLPICQFYAASVDYLHPQRRYGGTQDNSSMRTATGAVNDFEILIGGDGFYTLVDPTNSNIIYAESQYGGLARTTDNGEIWYDATFGIGMDDRVNWSMPVAISPHNPQTLYCGTQYVYRSNDGAETWTPISPDLSGGPGSGNLIFGTITTLGVSPVMPDVIWAGTDNARVWYTDDGGNNWAERSTGLPARWITRVTPDPNSEATVYVTVSGFRNVENDAHLFRSTDFGVTWQSLSGDLPPGPLNDVIVDSLAIGVLYVASDFGVYVTPDFGAHWTRLGSDMPRVPVIDLELHQPTRALQAATYGRSLYTLNLNELDLGHPPQITTSAPLPFDTLLAPDTVTFSVTAQDADGDSLRIQWYRDGVPTVTSAEYTAIFNDGGRRVTIEVTVSDDDYADRRSWNFYVVRGVDALARPEVPSSPLLISIYPNPFNATATLEYSLPVAGHVNLSVYDLLGRCVATLISGPTAAGEGRVLWSANALPTGTYLVALSAAGQTRLQKALIIR